MLTMLAVQRITQDPLKKISPRTKFETEDILPEEMTRANDHFRFLITSGTTESTPPDDVRSSVIIIPDDQTSSGQGAILWFPSMSKAKMMK